MHLTLLTTDTPGYEAMIALRMAVLLAPIGIPRSYINPQKEAGDSLIGAFDEGRLIGCCILTRIDEDTVQLRQMAVDSGLQRKGIGAAVLAYAEDLAKTKGYKTLMMHARESVTGFYRNCGYAVTGERFFEVDIPHVQMEKHL